METADILRPKNNTRWQLYHVQSLYLTHNNNLTQTQGHQAYYVREKRLLFLYYKAIAVMKGLYILAKMK